MASDDEVLATVSTGSGVTEEEVDLASATPIAGTFVPTSAAGTIGDNPLVLFNWDPATQLAGFIAAVAAGDASIVDEGDSTTLGFGSAASGFRDLSYSAEMAQALTQDGVAAQSDNFLGLGNEGSDDVDQRLTFLGTAGEAFPFDAGGEIIKTQAAGDGFDFTLNTPGDYNQLTVSYLDAGTGSDSVSVVSSSGAVTELGSINFTNTGQTLKQSFSFTPGDYSEMILTQTGSAATYIQGASFWSTTSPAIQVEDAGIGGETAEGANTSSVFYTEYTGSTEGAGATAGVATLNPSLAIVDFGINDIDNSSYDGETVATMVSSYEGIVTSLKSSGADVIMMLPAPWSSPYLSGNSGETYYQQDFPALLAALEAFSVTENVPIINLSATYGNSYTSLAAAGLLSSDDLHPDATLYADIGSQLAALLSNAINGTDNATAVTVEGSAGNDTLTGSATNNTLVGDGGDDTYVVRAADQTDTIINGLGTSTAPAGDLDIGAFNHEQLWFQQSGENLVLSILGTGQQVILQDWFAGTGGQALSKIIARDGALSYANLAPLMQAMAAYEQANPGFDPSTTTDGDLPDALTQEAATAWALGSEDPPCFCAGTHILTPGGDVPVETLRIGDPVVTQHAGIQRIKWIGRRSYTAPFAHRNPSLQPVCIRRSALGPLVPARDLWVSPGHGIQLGGALVHALRLVNGVTVLQPGDVARIQYFHIELDNHEIIFAENCPTESFLARAFRLRFQNAAEFALLYPGGAEAGTVCLRHLDDGFLINALLARVAARAGIGQKPAQGPIRGYVEALGPECIGWAQAPGSTEAPVCLDVLAGPRRAARVLANRPRADLRQAGLGPGNNGFSTSLPPGVNGVLAVREAATGSVLQTTPELARRRA